MQHLDETMMTIGQPPPPSPNHVWQPYAFGGGQWVLPAPVRLSDADVERIAAAVVRLQRTP